MLAAPHAARLEDVPLELVDGRRARRRSRVAARHLRLRGHADRQRLRAQRAAVSSVRSLRLAGRRGRPRLPRGGGPRPRRRPCRVDRPLGDEGCSDGEGGVVEFGAKAPVLETADRGARRRLEQRLRDSLLHRRDAGPSARELHRREPLEASGGERSPRHRAELGEEGREQGDEVVARQLERHVAPVHQVLHRHRRLGQRREQLAQPLAAVQQPPAGAAGGLDGRPVRRADLGAEVVEERVVHLVAPQKGVALLVQQLGAPRRGALLGALLGQRVQPHRRHKGAAVADVDDESVDRRLATGVLACERLARRLRRRRKSDHLPPPSDGSSVGERRLCEAAAGLRLLRTRAGRGAGRQRERDGRPCRRARRGPQLSQQRTEEGDAALVAKARHR
mmetsp:Transcript_40261/g.124018  ORF Transcript_40261/g.124018 Transcript_40261/m.124018 type:complete len:392 (-) Transcript_40261:323-1498(-)